MEKPLENRPVTRNWIRIALLNFVFAASLGATLRFAFVEELSWMNYRHFLHAHSHIAMLGWLYMIFYALLIQYFLPSDLQKQPFYRRLFWLTEISVLGMLFSFPVQGYGPVSISFSTLHVICSYIFCWKFYRDLKNSPTVHKQSRILVRLALLFQIISTLGLWAMGPVIALGAKGTMWYNMAVQFYLHFQFNGWFFFAGLALLFQLIQPQNFNPNYKVFRQFIWLMIAATMATYSLILAWSDSGMHYFALNSLGVGLQLVALLLLIRFLRPSFSEWGKIFSPHQLWLIRVAVIAFVAKVVIHSLIIIPYLATIGYTIRNFMIGFIHLMLLGMISHFVLGIASKENLLPLTSRMAKWGIGFFFTGFLLSELLLFLQGTLFWAAKGLIPFYYEGLFGVSTLMPLGIVLLLFSQFEKIHVSPSFYQQN
ncbi:MAG: hypothetical protein KDE26_11930 [Bacteroidetes bacterium]|nr:hypothetical protein [Bacteroidota bacterium]MCB0843954.1 hypothetical protein [Bacteroidota bacterium]